MLMLKKLTDAIRRRLLEDALVEFLLESRSGFTAPTTPPASGR